MAGAVGLANMTSASEDQIIAGNIAKERAHLARLKEQYGQQTLEAAYKKHAPWYQFGGVENSKPENVESWAKQYTAGGGAGAAAAKTASDAAKAAQPKANITTTNTYTVTVTTPPGADAAQMKAAVEQAVRSAQKKAQAEQNSALTDKTGY
jgi:hypothetical protein